MKRSASDSEKKLIYLVEDHAMVREGLRTMINQSADLAVCGEADSAEEALHEIPKIRLDLAIIDLTLPGTGGLELVKSLSDRAPDVPILVLSMHDETFFAERALRAGAKGYIMKHHAIGELQAAIHRVIGGGIYVSQAMSDRLLQALAGTDPRIPKAPLELLSDRELEVLGFIGKGMSTGEIARTMFLSVKTIETYRWKLKEKLGLKTGLQLHQYAVKWVLGGKVP